MEAKISKIKLNFPASLRLNNDLDQSVYKEELVHIREAQPATSLREKFYRFGKNSDMATGIMFHGTHHEDIDPICRSGMHRDSYFTSSFGYAVGRAHYKEWRNKERGYMHCWPGGHKDVCVLAMAVLVRKDDEWMIRRRDESFLNSDIFLPLFVITVRITYK